MNHGQKDILKEIFKRIKSQKEIPTSHDFEDRFFEKLEEKKNKSNAILFIPNYAYKTALATVIIAVILIMVFDKFNFLKKKNDEFTLDRKYKIDSNLVISIDTNDIYNSRFNSHINDTQNYLDHPILKEYLDKTNNNYNLIIESPQMGFVFKPTQSMIEFKISINNAAPFDLKLKVYLGSNLEPIWDRDITLLLSNNKNIINEVFQTNTTGQYYWELVNKSDKVYVGNFFIGNPPKKKNDYN